MRNYDNMKEALGSNMPHKDTSISRVGLNDFSSKLRCDDNFAFSG